MTPDALLAQLVERPDDLDAFRVYADLLMSAGDPRGELVALQCANDPAADALMWSVVNPLVDLQLGTTPRPSYTWRFGFIDTITFSHAGDEPFAVLPALAAEPAARLLRRLVIDAVQMDGRGDLAPVLAELAGLARAFPCLREVAVVEGANLGNPWIDGAIAIGDVSPLYAAFPRLEVLDLDGSSLELGAIEMPAVRRFRATHVGLANAAGIAAAHWPRLDSLDVAIAGSFADAAAALRRLLDIDGTVRELSVSLPDMLHVALHLPASRLARRARVLGFGRDRVDDDWVRRLLDHTPRLRQLDEVRFARHQLSAGARVALTEALGRVFVVR